METIWYKDHLVLIERLHSGTRVKIFSPDDDQIFNQLMILFSKKELKEEYKSFIDSQLANSED